jgi:hypothetical protein
MSGGGGKNNDNVNKPQGGGSGGKADVCGRLSRQKGKCNYYGIEGHWARECRKVKCGCGDHDKRDEQG